MPSRIPIPSLRNALALSQPRQITAMPFMNSSGTSARYSTPSDAPFSYSIGAASSGKQTPLRPAKHGQNYFSNLLLDQHSSYFTSNARFSGEDAFFMAHVARSKSHPILGLADGVGGWADQGVDPGKFSHGLCKYMADMTSRPGKEEDLRPRNLLQYGFDQVQKDNKIEAGGSTACVGALDPKGNFEAANLGDSGFLILSPGKVSYKSQPQTHAFNTPFQLSKLTAQLRKQNAIFGNKTQIEESPNAADVTNHRVRHGDMIVFGTDGVWDNLSAMEILGVVGPLMEKAGHWSGTSTSSDTKEAVVRAESLRPSSDEAQKKLDQLPSEIAYAIMRAAKVASLDNRRDGPFAKEVHKYYPEEEYHGGKVDDIAVIACMCVRAGPVRAKL